MALKLPAAEAANVAIQSIGCGYDISLDLRLTYCKRGSSSDVVGDYHNQNRLIEVDEAEGRDIVLPCGLLIPNVARSIRCDRGEQTRFRSDVLSFQLMSEHFNQDLSLTGKVPSGLFNAMFEFSGSWQKDASSTKTLSFEGMFISLYTIALEKSHILLSDHVKKAVPSSWDPPLLASFIERFGTHIVMGVNMGGKDVIYMKQQHTSSLQPAEVQKRLEAMADKRFLDLDEQYGYDMRGHRLRFADTSPSSSYSYKENLVTICKRRGGTDNRHLNHNDWLHSVQLEPDVIATSFIPITSLLNGVSGSGYLSHAINLYLRYKPPIEELHQFLEFQLPRQWAPEFSDIPLGPHLKQTEQLFSDPPATPLFSPQTLPPRFRSKSKLVRRILRPPLPRKSLMEAFLPRLHCSGRIRKRSLHRNRRLLPSLRSRIQKSPLFTARVFNFTRCSRD